MTPSTTRYVNDQRWIVTLLLEIVDEYSFALQKAKKYSLLFILIPQSQIVLLLLAAQRMEIFLIRVVLLSNSPCLRKDNSSKAKTAIVFM